jgi:hypothetical protein
MLRTWVINLDSQPERLANTMQALPSELGAERFPALLPDRTKLLTHFSYFCPDKTLGIAQSHQAVAATIYDQGDEFALILEDDVFPTAGTLMQDLEDVMRSQAPGWDIILLNACGPNCAKVGERPGRLCGSNAADLIAREGARKLLGLTVSWHIDVARNTDLFDVRQGPELFTTRDMIRGPLLGSRDIFFYGHQPLLYWPNGAIRIWHFTILLALALAALVSSARISGSYPGTAVVLALGSGAPLAFVAALVWHSCQDSNFARCAPQSRVLILTTAAVLLLLSMRDLAQGRPLVALPTMLLALVVVILMIMWSDEAYVHMFKRDAGLPSK